MASETVRQGAMGGLYRRRHGHQWASGQPAGNDPGVSKAAQRKMSAWLGKNSPR